MFYFPPNKFQQNNVKDVSKEKKKKSTNKNFQKSESDICLCERVYLKK